MISREAEMEIERFKSQIKDAEERFERYNRELMEAPIEKIGEVDISGLEDAKDVLCSAWLIFGRGSEN